MRLIFGNRKTSLSFLSCYGACGKGSKSEFMLKQYDMVKFILREIRRLVTPNSRHVGSNNTNKYQSTQAHAYGFFIVRNYQDFAAAVKQVLEKATISFYILCTWNEDAYVRVRPMYWTEVAVISQRAGGKNTKGEKETSAGGARSKGSSIELFRCWASAARRLWSTTQKYHVENRTGLAVQTWLKWHIFFTLCWHVQTANRKEFANCWDYFTRV